MSKSRLLSLLSLLSGGLYVIAFSPLQQYWLAFVVPALLLYCWKDASVKQAFYRGFLFGLGEFGIGTSWVYVSIHQFGNANVLLAGFITLLFTIMLALYPALQGALWRRFFRKKSQASQFLITFPISWVFFEWLRGWLFTGFPWLMLGYTQTTSIFNAYAALIGVYGITWLIALINGGIILLCCGKRRSPKLFTSMILFTITIVALIFHDHPWTKTEGKPLSVALIQGNIPQQMKWDNRYINDALKRYYHSTLEAIDHDLIVWPEAAIPVLPEQAQGLIDELNQIGKQHHSAIIFGIPTSGFEQTQYYNSMMIVGNGSGTYRKRHLVPFGEYTPLDNIFNPIMQYFSIPLSGLMSGASEQTALSAQDIRLAPFICYEIVYPKLAIQTARQSQLMIVINDDSWFGDSLAASQQLQMAQLRAIETGRYLLYASNTGITTIISPFGKLVAVAPEQVFTVLSGEVYAMSGNTPLMRYAYYPFWSVMALLFIMALFQKSQRLP